MSSIKTAVITFLVSVFLFFNCSESILAQTISNISFDPVLDISYFGSYTLTADITPEPGSATLSLQGLNGNDGDGDDWNFCADGTGTGQTLSYNMVLYTGITWRKTLIRPDSIYPQILFSPSSTTWGTTPSDMNTRRNNYQMLHFINPFTMEDDMNFWIEINAVPVSTVNSADLAVYLVKKGKTSSFFQSDWRNNSTDVELVGTIDRNASFDHTHSASSEHHLIRLSTNNDKTVGLRNLDIGEDFWLILYNTSPNVNRGWNLKYQTTSICTNTSGWYSGNQTGWTTANETGFPDVHVHFARKSAHADGVRATVTAGSSSLSEDFTFAAPPNLPPNATNFTAPVNGVYSGTFNVTWQAASDPNEDTLHYNLYLVDSLDNETLLGSDIVATSYSWNTTDGEIDGDYTIRGQVCDNQTPSLCTDFYSQPFSLNNTSVSIKSLSSIMMSSTNSDTTKAIAGDTVSLTFTSSAAITSPTVAIYSGGYNVTNSVTVSSSNNINWTASYTVSASDTNGQVTFTISASDLNLEYTEITSGSYVTVANTQNTNSVNTDVGSSACNSQTPIGIPDLFQIDVNKTKATLFFTPINSPVTDYYISYSEKSNKSEHGTFTNQSSSGGVLSFTVNHLKPNTTYYFRIRGQNGCMPGNYSQEMKVVTKQNKVTYYKYGSVVTKSLNKIISVKKETVKNQEVTQPSITSVQPIKSPEKKRCFLWWCF